MIAITPIPAFNDNYLWLIDNGSDAVVVDPGDGTAVQRYLQDNELNLVAILVTHHHADHTGGVIELKQWSHCRVYGPKSSNIAGLDITCQEGDSILIDELPLKLEVLEVPGHTLDHIAYFAAKNQEHKDLLFCGDTVFSGGCGRLFEGTAQQMWSSMSKIMTLPAETQLYPAHEYTQSNLTFARAVEPDNQNLLQYSHQVDELRRKNVPSLPTTLAVEKRINPFMRITENSVINAAKKQVSKALNDDAAVFASIRHWKDRF